MLVFISWSGHKSKFVAEALEAWLPDVIHAIDTWISQDIEKGRRWEPEIADRLERSKVGIICLTNSNLDARWIHFEAGALSKTKDAYVCTLLLDIKSSDVDWPLAQFQHTTIEKDQIFKLLKTINGVVETSGEKSLTEVRLKDVFETYWPRLEEVFQQSTTLQESATSPSRTTDEILEEMLEILRNQERLLSYPVPSLQSWVGARSPSRPVNKLPVVGVTAPINQMINEIEAIRADIKDLLDQLPALPALEDILKRVKEDIVSLQGRIMPHVLRSKSDVRVNQIYQQMAMEFGELFLLYSSKEAGMKSSNIPG